MPFRSGDPAPWFTQRNTSNPKFHFDTVAGRYIVLSFPGSSSDPAGNRVITDFTEKLADRFDDRNACLFLVSNDPLDESLGRVRERLPGIRWFWDSDHAVAEKYEVVGQNTTRGNYANYNRFTLLLDPGLRTIRCLPMTQPETHAEQVVDLLDRLAPMSVYRGHPPVLMLPRVFEPEFCRHLIDLYEQHGGEDSGFMRDVNGKTVGIIDYGHKKRDDYLLTDEKLMRVIQEKILRRVVPEVRKAFNFEITRMERYLVACYDASSRGHFNAHRDNTTKGTAHRRFACTINLNAEEFEGGELRFPEYGQQTYRAPTGGCVIFGCSLLHEATVVTSGRRFAFLPFLYDEAAARVRQMNLQFLSSEVINRQAEPPQATRPATDAGNTPAVAGRQE